MGVDDSRKPRAGWLASVCLSAAVGIVVALWAVFAHGRPIGGSLVVGAAFFVLGVGTLAIVRSGARPLPSFVSLALLYFFALYGLRWVSGERPGPVDALGAVLYGAVLTWLLRAQRLSGRDVRAPRRRRG